MEKSNIAELTAIVSGSPPKALAIAAKHAAKVFSSEQYGELLKSELVDAVYVALPNDMHAQYSIAALEAGIHVMVEKPLALSAAEGEAMIAAAAKGRAKLMTAYRLYCDEPTTVFLNAIKKGEIGQPRIFTTAFSFSIPGDNHRLSAKAWGGPLQDVGVYCVNMARRVFGADPIDVVAAATRPPDDACFAEVDEGVSAILRFPGDRLAVFATSFGTAEQDWLRVTGTAGSLEMDQVYRYETGRKITLSGTPKPWTKVYPCADNFLAQIDYFADCIQNDKAVGPDGVQGLKDLKVLLAVEKATQTGQRQVLS